MSGGWYCTECGTIQALPSGTVRCRRCGEWGLRGFEGSRPRRVTCPDHPSWRGWNDGVNDDLGRHRRLEHGEATTVVGGTIQHNLDGTGDAPTKGGEVLEREAE